MQNIKILSESELKHALQIRDLTDPSLGGHAMQILVEKIYTELQSKWHCEVMIHRGSSIVNVQDNYDRLHYPQDGVARSPRYTRYVSTTEILRTQMSAVVPSLLDSLPAEVKDTLLVCPGIVYRRDSIDKLHTGEPHQLDLWRISDKPLHEKDLLEMIEIVVRSLLPHAEYRCNRVAHPYTTNGLEIEVKIMESWIEIGECGLVLPDILVESGHSSSYGLAMGLGLDRLLMILKGIDDIRLLRAEDRRVSSQLLDLAPYRQVSLQPAVVRDLSLVVSKDITTEDLGDKVRSLTNSFSSNIEEIIIVAETLYDDLHSNAVQRLGLGIDQKNALVRLVIRDLERTLTTEEANKIRNEVYLALHEGPNLELC